MTPLPSQKLTEALRELDERLRGIPFQSLTATRNHLTSLSQWAFTTAQSDRLARAMQQLARSTDSPLDLYELLCGALGLPEGTPDAIAELSDVPQVVLCPCPGPLRRLPVPRRKPPGVAAGHSSPAAGRPDITSQRRLRHGKGHPVYNLHAYHTKVPPEAIVECLLRHSAPGDIVFDGFCGSGMTGVAAQWCGDADTLSGLGYTIDEAGQIWQPTTSDENPGRRSTAPVGRLGARQALLADLSPAATFIASALNTPADTDRLAARGNDILTRLADQWSWLYRTWHNDEERGRPAPAPWHELQQAVASGTSAEELADQFRSARAKGSPLANVERFVWSDVFGCPACGARFTFHEAAVDADSGRVARSFPCPDCGLEQPKRLWERPVCHVDDPVLGRSVPMAEQELVYVEYRWEGQRFGKRPDALDRQLAAAAIRFVPAESVPRVELFAGKETSRNRRLGITHVHHFYTWRNLLILAALHAECRTDRHLRFWFSSHLANLSRLNRYRPDVTFPYNPLSGTYYIGSRTAESNPWTAYRHKLSKLTRTLRPLRRSQQVECRSLTACHLPPRSVDYVFTDPPFGGNLAYAELNLLCEAWLGVRTRRVAEAVENRAAGKSVADYQAQLAACFESYYRVLKPGRMMTLLFHHTQAEVWAALQSAVWEAGFELVSIGFLDKGLDTFKQSQSAGSVKHDLLIDLRKPRRRPAARQPLQPGRPDEVWAWLDAEAATWGDAPPEPSSLYGRAVAHLMQQGKTVPVSAGEFYRQLMRRV